MGKLTLWGTIAVVVLLTVGGVIGCAAVFKGSSNKVDFKSEPTGAQVYVNGNLMGTAPVKLKLASDKTYHIEFKKEGFATKTFNITNSVGVGWIVVDVIFGLLPVVIDAATGSWYSLDQDNINAILEKQQ